MSQSLAIEISYAEIIHADADDIPEPELFEEWAAFAYVRAIQHMQDSETFVPKDTDEHDQSSYDDQEDTSALVSIRITDADEIQQLNDQFRGLYKPTNVLSFPMSDVDGMAFDGSELVMLGDIVMCAPVIKHEALKQGKELNAHWAHMVVHSILHLKGFDHIENEQAEEMEKLETEILQDLGFESPYE